MTKGPLGIVDWGKVANETVASMPQVFGARISYTIQSMINNVIVERIANRPFFAEARQKAGWTRYINR